MIDPALLTVITTLAGSKVSRQVVKAAIDWLKNNEDVGASIVALAKVEGGGSQALINFVRWVAAKKSNMKGENPIPALESVPLNQAPNVLEALGTAERISGSSPGRMVVPERGKLELVRAERRVGLATTKVDGIHEPVLLVHSEPAAMATQARVTSNLPRMLVVGHGAAALPGGRPPMKLTVPEAEHRPGRSIAHSLHIAGSLGAYVKFVDEKTDREVLGFVGASHVLSKMDDCNQGDAISSPGYPDRERQGRYKYGMLVDWRRLVHYSSQTDPNLVVNDADVALALLPNDIIPRNQVRDPNDEAHLLEVTNVMSLMEIRDHSGNDVFMVGRTTEFSHGKLTATDVTEFPIRMPNGKSYMFGGLATVKSVDPNRRFSTSGDSGAIVYVVADGKARALGFVVGGSDRATFVTPAVKCLSAVQATLL